MVIGADLSHFNTGIELSIAKESGLQFVFLKATEGLTFVDPTYEERLKECRDLGIPVGAYHFGTGDDPVFQSEHFMRVASTADVLALDFEPNPTGESMSAGQATLFLAKVGIFRPGRTILYSGSWLKEHDTDMLRFYPLWLAEHGPKPNLPEGFQSYLIWQNAIKNFPGLGVVDIDLFNGDMAAFKSFWGIK